MKLKTARILMIASMGIFGTIGLLVRNIAMPSAQIAMCRAVLASVMLGVYLLVTKQRIGFRKIGKELPLLLLSGAAMGINWILLFEAYKYTTVSLATLSYYFAPVLVTLACPILFREKMGARQWICFAMSTVGIVLLTGIGETGTADTHLKGILFGLGAAAFYASVILLNKFIKNVSGIHRTFLQFVAAVVVLVPYVLFSGDVSFSALDASGLACLLVVGIVHTGITYCMYFSALRELPGQKVAILSYIDPLVAVLVSVVILRETMQPLQIVGGLLILGFTLWNEIAPVKKKEKVS